LGAFSAVALALGGGAVALLQPGIGDGRLSASGRVVFSGAARGLLDGVLPGDSPGQRVALDALLGRIDALVANLPPHAQDELSQLLALLASAPGRRAFASLDAPWPEASAAQIQDALQSMRVSAVSLKQQGYQALHDIVGAAYFSDSATWGLIGYPGPLKI